MMISYKPIPIFDNVEWSLTEEALSIIILAPSGSGKSIFLNYLAAMVIKRGHILHVVDGKNTSFGAVFKSVGVPVATNPTEIIQMLSELVVGMECRYQDIFSSDEVNMDDNFSALGLRANVLIFDEILSVLDSGDKDQKREMLRLLQQIALKGRQSGYSIVISSQRLLSSDLPKSINEQCQTRIILGDILSVSEELFHIATHMYKKDLPTRYKGGVGKGYAITPKTGLKYIETPFMKISGADFKDLLMKLVERRDKREKRKEIIPSI